jgi:hypothetical protein
MPYPTIVEFVPCVSIPGVIRFQFRFHGEQKLICDQFLFANNVYTFSYLPHPRTTDNIRFEVDFRFDFFWTFFSISPEIIDRF